MKKLFAICILSLIAFFNATYLTVENYKLESAVNKWSVSSFCDLNNVFSCTNVLSSQYSKVFGVPFPAIALVVYPIIFVIALLGVQWLVRKPFHILAFFWLGWMLFNWFFITREYLYIGSYCPLCLMCSAIIITIFILSIIWIKSGYWNDKKLV